MFCLFCLGHCSWPLTDHQKLTRNINIPKHVSVRLLLNLVLKVLKYDLARACECKRSWMCTRVNDFSVIKHCTFVPVNFVTFRTSPLRCVLWRHLRLRGGLRDFTFFWLVLKCKITLIRRKRLSIIFLLGNVKIMKLSNKTLVAYFIKLSTPISNFNGLIVMQGPLALKRFRYSSVLAALHHKGLKRTCTSLDVAVHLVSWLLWKLDEKFSMSTFQMPNHWCRVLPGANHNLQSPITSNAQLHDLMKDP